MARTPDRAAGPLFEEEEVRITDTGLDPAVAGAFTYSLGDLRGRDVLGTFSVRFSYPDHHAARQLIHFIDDGPTDGFASGSYKETTYSNTAFLSTATWYEDNTKAKKIVDLVVTYSGVFPSSEQWRMYDTDGTSVLVTLTDSITYDGPFEVTRTRTWV